MHAQKNWDLYNVMKSGQGFQSQPLAIVITTAGYRLAGYPLYEMRQVCIDILIGVKDDDSQFSALYQLDDDDDWMNDETCWVKANPSLGHTVTYEYLRDQVSSCRNNPSLVTGVKTKNFNMFCSSAEYWLDNVVLRECMQRIDIEDYRGYQCYIGVDLAATSDLTAISVLIPTSDKAVFKTYVFVPEETVKNSPNRPMYERWARSGDLIITPGNVTDYTYIKDKILEINNLCRVVSVFYDAWNASQFCVEMVEAGFDMEPFSQSIGNYNKPTKEFERLVLSKNVVIDTSELILWCFNNVVLRYDSNDNCKPTKGQTKYDKIDPVISMLTALGGYLSNPQYSTEMWVV